MSDRIMVLNATADDFALEVLSSVPVNGSTGDHADGRIVRYLTHLYMWHDASGEWVKFNNVTGFTSLETRLSVQESECAADELSLAGIDSSLETRISDEESAMVSAVSAEESRAESVEGSLETVISSLTVSREAHVSSEQSRQESVGASLETRISTEESVREAAVDSLELRAMSAETSLDARLSNEESAEAAAEASLDARVSAEESVKLIDDGSIATAIASAATARGAADTSLETRLSNEENRVDAILNASTADKDSFVEIVSFINAVDVAHDAQTSTEISSIDSSIASAEAARSVSDDSLETRLSNEEDAEVSAEASLNTRMAAEESNELSAEVSLDARMSSEESARLAEDNSLGGRMGVNEGDRATDDTSLETRLSNEEDAMAAGDASVEVLLSSAISGREAVGDSLEVRMSEEESAMLSAVASEEADRISADGSLETRVSSEEDARFAGDNSLTVRTLTEETDRNVADASLETRLSNEESAESAAKDSLETRISAEEDAMAAGDASVQTSLSAQVSSERSRIDGILDNAAADKDTFAEIVSFITAVDTESDDALASYVTAIDSSISAEESAMAAGDASLEVELSSKIVERQSAVTSLETKHSGEISTLASAIDSLELREEERHVRIDFTNQTSFTVLASDLPSGFTPDHGMVQVFQEVSANTYRHLVSPMNYDPSTGEMTFNLGVSQKTGFAVFYTFAGDGTAMSSSASAPGSSSSSSSSYAEHRITDATLTLGASVGDTTTIVFDVTGVTAANVNDYMNYDAIYLVGGSSGSTNSQTGTINRSWNSDYSQFTVSWANAGTPSASSSYGYYFQIHWGSSSYNSFISITSYFDGTTLELTQQTGSLGEYLANNTGGFPINPPYIPGTGTATYDSNRTWAFWGSGSRRKYNRGVQWIFDMEEYTSLLQNLRNYIYQTGAGYQNNGATIFPYVGATFTKNGTDYYANPSIPSTNHLYSEITTGRTSTYANRVNVVVGGDLHMGWWTRNSSSNTSAITPDANSIVTFYIANNDAQSNLITSNNPGTYNNVDWAGDTANATDIKIVIDTSDQSYEIYRNSNVGGSPTWVAVDRAYLSNQEVN